jgi:hypothetical protein
LWPDDARWSAQFDDNIATPLSISRIDTMSLSAPVERTPLHTRTIVCHGFKRADGHYDIEASIIDVKAYQYTEPFRGVREPGSHVHEMWVRLTVGEDMVVKGIEVSMPATPYPACQTAKPNFQGLIGVTVGGGWRRAVQECVGNVRGCTHVRELLFPMATVAFQTIGGWPVAGEEPKPAPIKRAEKPRVIDGCIAWASDGEVVAKLHPEFATRPGSGAV